MKLYILVLCFLVGTVIAQKDGWSEMNPADEPVAKGGDGKDATAMKGPAVDESMAKGEDGKDATVMKGRPIPAPTGKPVDDAAVKEDTEGGKTEEESGDAWDTSKDIVWDAKQTELWTQLWLTSLLKAHEDMDTVSLFYDKNSLIWADKERFVGPDISQFYSRWLKAAEWTDALFTIDSIDDTAQIAVITYKVSGTWTDTQETFTDLEGKILCVWNGGFIETQQMFVTDPQIATAAPKALQTWFALEKAFWENGLDDKDSPAMALMSDDVEVILHANPPELWPENEWKGKEEVLKAWTAHWDRMKEMLQPWEFRMATKMMTVTPIAPTEDSLWVKWEWSNFGSVLAQYTFDTSGLLLKKEIWMSHWTMPWEAYPKIYKDFASSDTDEELDTPKEDGDEIDAPKEDGDEIDAPKEDGDEIDAPEGGEELVAPKEDEPVVPGIKGGAGGEGGTVAESKKPSKIEDLKKKIDEKKKEQPKKGD